MSSTFNFLLSMCFFTACTETTSQFENCAIVVGFDYCPTVTNDVIEINLHRKNEISRQTQIPATIDRPIEAIVGFCCKTTCMYVTGVGVNNDEIWKCGYNDFCP